MGSSSWVSWQSCPPDNLLWHYTMSLLLLTTWPLGVWHLCRARPGQERSSAVVSKALYLRKVKLMWFHLFACFFFFFFLSKLITVSGFEYRTAYYKSNAPCSCSRCFWWFFFFNLKSKKQFKEWGTVIEKNGPWLWNPVGFKRYINLPLWVNFASALPTFYYFLKK